MDLSHIWTRLTCVAKVSYGLLNRVAMERKSAKRIRSAHPVTIDSRQITENLVIAAACSEKEKRKRADEQEAARVKAEEDTDMKAEDKTKIETVAAADQKRAENIAFKRSEQEAARIKINAEKARNWENGVLDYR